MIQFSINITPIGKPRMTRSDAWRKRPAVVRYFMYKDALVAAANRAGIDGSKPPEHVKIYAEFKPPNSWSKKKAAAHILKLHQQKPDCDNILKGVVDCIWQADQKISKMYVQKIWAEKDRLTIVAKYKGDV